MAMVIITALLINTAMIYVLGVSVNLPIVGTEAKLDFRLPSA